MYFTCRKNTVASTTNRLAEQRHTSLPFRAPIPPARAAPIPPHPPRLGGGGPGLGGRHGSGGGGGEEDAEGHGGAHLTGAPKVRKRRVAFERANSVSGFWMGLHAHVKDETHFWMGVQRILLELLEMAGPSSWLLFEGNHFWWGKKPQREWNLRHGTVSQKT